MVLITTISHGVRELQRSLQFRSVDNHCRVARYYFALARREFLRGKLISRDTVYTVELPPVTADGNSSVFARLIRAIPEFLRTRDETDLRT